MKIDHHPYRQTDRDRDQALGMGLAIVLGVLLAAAALHFLQPCHGSSLCALAVTPTRLTAWRRLWSAVQARYWRLLRDAAVHDLAHQLLQMEHMPRQVEHTRKRIVYLTRRMHQAGAAGERRI